MYKCRDCGEEFATPKKVQEYIGEYFGFPAYEQHMECPICGSEDYEEWEGYFNDQCDE